MEAQQETDSKKKKEKEKLVIPYPPRTAASEELYTRMHDGPASGKIIVEILLLFLYCPASEI